MLAFGKIENEQCILTFNTGGIINVISLTLEDSEQLFKTMLKEIYKYKINQLDYSEQLAITDDDHKDSLN